MMIDNCVVPLSDKRVPNINSNSTNDVNCRNLVESNNLIGPLDTGGAPLQLGDKISKEDQRSAYFSGCIKNLRINDEV